MLLATESDSTNSDRLLTEEEATELLTLKPGTLAAWRHHKRHDLKYVRIGRCVRYPLAEVRAFINRNTVGAK